MRIAEDAYRVPLDDSMIGRWLSELPMDDPTRKRTSKPMLRRFVHHDKPIHHIKCLGDGSEGAVCLVEIEGTKYAIKIFKEYIPIGLRRFTERQLKYTSPFSHECRAFARLDSLGENGTWAVKCHGWMKLSDKQFRQIGKWWLTRWVIVKEYLPDPLTLADVPEIRRKMKIAREARLHPRDLRPQNYQGSFLVDLGQVFTYPYLKQLWSDSRRRAYFEWFDEYATGWEVSVWDGTVIERWLNNELKRITAVAEARKKKEAENGRSDDPVQPDSGPGLLLRDSDPRLSEIACMAPI